MRIVEDWDVLSEALDERMAACSGLPFQSLPAGHVEAVDAVTGRRVLLNPARAGRPRTGSAGEAYREGRTPPTLFFVAEDGPPVPRVETETETLSAAREWLAAATAAPAATAASAVTADPAAVADPAATGRKAVAEEAAPSPWRLVDSLGDRRRRRADGTRVPLVFPSVPWSVRTFFNLAPIVADRVSGANGFVLAVAPEYEAGDLGRLSADTHAMNPSAVGRSGSPGEGSTHPAASSPAGPPLVPGSVLDAVVVSWALLERWAERRDLVPIPFINGGKGRASGQSLDCFHAQFYALGAVSSPPFYEALRAAGAHEGCPMCRLASSGELEVARTGSVGVWAHPAPETEGTLVVAAADHRAAIASLPDIRDFARGIETAVRGFEALLGAVPPYNVAVRCGRHAGHLHAEVIPRAGVAVAAGFEKATGFSVSTRPPATVAAELRARAAAAGPATLP